MESFHFGRCSFRIPFIRYICFLWAVALRAFFTPLPTFPQSPWDRGGLWTRSRRKEQLEEARLERECGFFTYTLESCEAIIAVSLYLWYFAVTLWNPPSGDRKWPCAAQNYSQGAIHSGRQTVTWKGCFSSIITWHIYIISSQETLWKDDCAFKLGFSNGQWQAHGKDNNLWKGYLTEMQKLSLVMEKSLSRSLWSFLHEIFRLLFFPHFSVPVSHH